MQRLIGRGLRRGHVNVKVREVNNVRRNLMELFGEDNQKKALSETLRIFPTYFSPSYISLFCNNQHFDQYLTYIKSKTSKDNVREARRLFERNETLSVDFTNSALKSLEAFLHWLTNDCSSFRAPENDFLMEFANLQRIEKWYSDWEKKQPRVFIYHHGPTNSGKSTAAIQDLLSLREDQVGIYMAPLRLLAWEYQQKLGNCTLITGQEKEYKDSNLISCTIEAAPLKEEYEVAVVDEIQMIGNMERGAAWTKALMALKAKRIHLCGDERALGIVSKIVEACGDVLEERKYSRLSKLILIHRPFELGKMEPGDCVINFSAKKLIKHRNDINKMLYFRELGQKGESPVPESEERSLGEAYKNRTAMVYGKLPPDCRKNQARAFNSNELPYLVATNAIGMGLNLNIKKVILMAIDKQDKEKVVELEEHDIQQIAGRAGRGTETGFVQCANKRILSRVQRALSKVNSTYGIQLENQQDETGDRNRFQEELQGKKYLGHRLYNNLLGREMTEKETHIKQAIIDFDPKYIKGFYLAQQHFMKKKLPVSKLIQHLRLFAKLSPDHTVQDTEHISYILELLQDSNLDIEDILLFHNGLVLSLVTYSPKGTNLFSRVRKTHKEYIKNFIRFRKVPLPSFIVEDYHHDYQDYQYMDQIHELQVYYTLLESYVWLWGKYEFSFHQVKLARKIKERLETKIDEILVNNRFTKDSRYLSEQTPKDNHNNQPYYPSFEEAKGDWNKKKNQQPSTPPQTPKFVNSLKKSEKGSLRKEGTIPRNGNQELPVDQ